ncbi:hypothetical protein Hanom_Chr15g01388851 [Helianthus anomalus]
MESSSESETVVMESSSDSEIGQSKSRGGSSPSTCMDNPNVSYPIFEGNMPAHGLHGDIETHPIDCIEERERVVHSPEEELHGNQCPSLNNISNFNKNSFHDADINGGSLHGENNNFQVECGPDSILNGPPEIGNVVVDNGLKFRPSYITKRPKQNSKKIVKSTDFITPDLNDKVIEESLSDPFDIEAIFRMEQHCNRVDEEIERQGGTGGDLTDPIEVHQSLNSSELEVDATIQVGAALGIEVSGFNNHIRKLVNGESVPTGCK